MRRLSILDLSAGHQPMSNEDGSVWIAYNGETFNFQELRPALKNLRPGAFGDEQSLIRITRRLRAVKTKGSFA